MARPRIFAPDRETKALYCTANGGPKQDHRDDPGAGVGALGLLAILAWLGVLAIGGGENPTELPLENYGITEDKVIDSDVSDNGLRAADLTVSSGDATSLEDYRAIARSIEDDEEYSDRDYISILFVKRLSGASPRYVPAVALTGLGRDQVSRIQDRPAYGSKDGDGVYLYTFPK